MSIVRIISTIGLSLAAAVGLGVAFQPDAPEDALRPAPQAAVAVNASLMALPGLPDRYPPAEAEAEQRAAVPTIATLTEVTPAPIPARTPPQAPVRGQARPLPEQTAADDGRSADATVADEGCALRAELAAQPAAMLSLTLHAACDALGPVTITHAGLTLAEAVGPDGRLDVALPALARNAVVTLATPDGRRVQVAAQVPDFDLYQRVVLRWDGAPVLDLHAFAGGAGWGEPGHVRAGGPVSAATGFIRAFGDPEIAGPRAVVFTYPVGVAATSGHVALEAQIAVAEPVCGRRFEAEVLGHVGGPRLLRREVSVEVPACGGPAGMVLLPDPISIGNNPALALLD